MTWVLTDDNGTEREFQSRAKAEETKVELEGIGADITLEQKGTEDVEAEIVDMSSEDSEEPLPGVDVCSQCGGEIDDGHCPNCESDEEGSDEDLPNSSEVVEAIETVKEGGLDTDPLNVLPAFMVDTIQGAQAVNKRGYAMIAERYDIEVSTEMVQSPWDNDEGRVVCKATAVTDDDKTYTAYGTACESDGDDSKNLIELADTRSQKRAVQWASGFGIVGYQELTGQLEEAQ